MVIVRRHFRSGRWLAAVLLAAYAPIALLGYGLHSVLRCDHCGDEAAAAAGHDCCCCHHHADHAAVARAADGAKVSRYAGAHDCAICQFLAQAQSPAVAYVAPENSAPLAPMPALGRPLVLAVACEAPLARGPPALA